MLNQVVVSEDSLIEDEILNSTSNKILSLNMTESFEEPDKINKSNRNIRNTLNDEPCAINTKPHSSSQRIEHFFSKLKNYQKQKEEKLKSSKQNIEALSVSSITPIPKISNRSKIIASTLNHTTEDRLLKRKKKTQHVESKSKNTSPIKKSYGAPSCFYSTAKKVESQFPIRKDPSISANTDNICKQRYVREINNTLLLLNKPTIDFEVFLVLLKNLKYFIEGQNKQESALELWKYAAEDKQSLTTEKLSELLYQMMSYNSSITEGPPNKITDIIKEFCHSRLLHRLESHNSSHIITKPLSLMSSTSKRLAEAYRSKVISDVNSKTIDLYEMSQIHQKHVQNKIRKLKDDIDKRLNMSCTFKPHLSSRSSSPGNVTSNSILGNSSNAFEISSRIKSNYERSSKDLSKDIIVKPYNKTPITQAVHYKRIISNKKLSDLQGCIESIERIKKGNEERERKQRNTQLRPSYTKDIKMSSTPCIFIDINFGKGHCERIEVYDKDNPTKIAKAFITKNSKFIIRTGCKL